MDLRDQHIYIRYRAVRVDQYARYNFFPFVDQSSSRGLEKSGENIPTIPEVIRAHTLNFKPHFKFSSSFFFGGGDPVPVRVCVCVCKSRAISIARTKI